MAKYDEQLGRMEYLMNFRAPLKESTRSNVEYSIEAANGKCYGIIKEANKYYIKECKDASRKTIAESYTYINGITAKKENEYKSYNEASKQLELKVMSINESRDNKVNASTFDFKRGEKVLSNLTEEARKELDRMHAILENANAIGMKNTGNPEAPKTASFTPSVGTPFEEKGEAELDKDLKATASDPKKVGEPFEEDGEVSNADMESDKAPKCDNGDEYEDAEYVPEDAVAAEKPAGGEVVRMNEDVEDILGIEPIDDETLEALTADEMEEPMSDVITDDEGMTDYEFSQRMAGEGEEVETPEMREVEPFETDDEYMTDREFADKRLSMESKKSLKTIVEGVCDELFKEHITMTKKSEEEKLMESFQKKVDALVKEEITNLNVFGKHPGYRKKPMTTPANTEVVKTNGDKDWNDDSVKGEKPFGQKIGDSAPFTEKVVNMLTDAVLKQIKEGLKKKIETESEESIEEIHLNERKVLKVGSSTPHPSQDMTMAPQEEMPMNNMPEGDGALNSEMPINDSGSEFDTHFDAGVEADEDEDPKKYIQQLTGKLSQELGKYNNELGEPDTELSKYVGGMIVKQVAKGLGEDDKKELIKKIKMTDSETEEPMNDELDNSMEDSPEMEQQMESYTLHKEDLSKLYENLIDLEKKDNDNLDIKKENKVKKNSKPFIAPKFN